MSLRQASYVLINMRYYEEPTQDQAINKPSLNAPDDIVYRHKNNHVFYSQVIYTTYNQISGLFFPTSEISDAASPASGHNTSMTTTPTTTTTTTTTTKP